MCSSTTICFQANVSPSWVWEAGGGWRVGSDGSGGGSSPSWTSWDHRAGPRWAENAGTGEAEHTSWPEQCQGPGHGCRKPLPCGSLKVGLYDGAWEAVSTALPSRQGWEG